MDVYQASVYFNWKSCVDVVAVVTINHLGVFLSNYCDVNAPKTGVDPAFSVTSFHKMNFFMGLEIEGRSPELARGVRGHGPPENF